jgi:pyruvate dehydrogenase E1 component alpha subunit
MSDPVSGTYRSTEEVDRAKKELDPIALLRDILMDADLLDSDGLEEMDAEARQTASDAADFADESPKPGADALYRNVWAVENEHGRLFFDGRDR